MRDHPYVYVFLPLYDISSRQQGEYPFQVPPRAEEVIYREQKDIYQRRPILEARDSRQQIPSEVQFFYDWTGDAVKENTHYPRDYNNGFR